MPLGAAAWRKKMHLQCWNFPSLQILEGTRRDFVKCRQKVLNIVFPFANDQEKGLCTMDAATALHYHMDMVVSAKSCEMFPIWDEVWLCQDWFIDSIPGRIKQTLGPGTEQFSCNSM